jgi:hypothetical protein
VQDDEIDACVADERRAPSNPKLVQESSKTTAHAKVTRGSLMRQSFLENSAPENSAKNQL